MKKAKSFKDPLRWLAFMVSSIPTRIFHQNIIKCQLFDYNAVVSNLAYLLSVLSNDLYCCALKKTTITVGIEETTYCNNPYTLFIHIPVLIYIL